MGFCLPSLPGANSPSRPHCLGNALQSPHKGKLHRGGWSCLTPGEGFHGNDDITRLVWLQSQALNGGAWVFHTAEMWRKAIQGLCDDAGIGGPVQNSKPSPALAWPREPVGLPTYKGSSQSIHLSEGGLKPRIVCRHPGEGGRGGRGGGGGRRIVTFSCAGNFK